jgi:uncharacterized membrane protein
MCAVFSMAVFCSSLTSFIILIIITIIIVEIHLSESWLSGSQIIRIGLAPPLSIFLL